MANTNHLPCRIACFSDTFGIQSNNGVGRFLHDLQHFSDANELPFKLVIAGKGEDTHALVQVRAPSFSLPTYSEVNLSMPLEHQRRRIQRELSLWQPDVVHVSTPGPFGCLGVSVASELKLPTVGIYHTDFPRYAKALVRKQIEHIKSNPLSYLGSFSANLLNKVGPLLAKLESQNPSFADDVELLTEIAQRNFKVLGGEQDWIELIADSTSRLTAKILGNFYARLSIVVARSPFHQHELCKSLDIDSDKVRTLRPGTDTTRFHPRFENRAIWQPLGISENDFVLLYVGRITTEKNIDLLIDVWNNLNIQHSDSGSRIHLVCVGYGSETDKARLQQLENVHVLGQKEGTELSQLYASADLLLFPSVTETLGQVGLEAAASATPMIASDFGGQTSYVQDRVTGILVSPLEPQTWATQILDLFNNRERLKKMGEDAFHLIQNNFSIEASLQSYWAIHEEATELAKEQNRIKKIKKRISTKRQSPPKNISPKPLMVLSDYHAGRRYRNEEQRRQKQKALESMLRLAADENMDVVYGGDFGDHGANS